MKYSPQENSYLISDILVVDNNRTNLEMFYQSWDQYTHHASRAFLFLAQFCCTWERLCMDPVRPFLSMCLTLLGYTSEPRPNSWCLFQRAHLWTSVYQWTDAHTRKTSNCLMREKQEWLVKKFMLQLLQRFDAIQAEPSFSLFDREEDKRRLCSQDSVYYFEVFLIEHLHSVIVAVWERWGLSADTVITKESEEPNNRVLLGALLFGFIISFIVHYLYLSIHSVQKELNDGYILSWMSCTL